MISARRFDDLRLHEEMSMNDNATTETSFHPAAAFGMEKGKARLNKHTAHQAADPQPACLTAVIATACAAVGLAAFVWTTYDSFDHNGFDIHAAVVVPAMSALDLGAPPQHASAQGSSSAASPATGTPAR
ncbi:MAG: hypothetical protein ABWZ88_11550 [Variovorax sp.]